jgi:hypothetical protein
VSYGSVDDIDEYARSISKMKWGERLSFVASEAEDVEIDSSSENDHDSEAWEEDATEHYARSVDLYSVSVYSSDLLGGRKSRPLTPLPFTIAPPLPLPQAPVDEEVEMSITSVDEEETEVRTSSVNDGEAEIVASSVGEDAIATKSEGLPQEADHADVVEPEKTKEIRISIEGFPTTRSHWKVELSFHAYGNWKRGVLAKVKNESKNIWETEKQRFGNLKPSYRSQNLLAKILDGVRSAFENEWREEKERLKNLGPECRGKNMRGAFW